MDFFWFWVLFFATAATFASWRAFLVGMAFLLAKFYFFTYEPSIKRNKFKVCIVGAGFSGIGIAIRLKKLGVDYEIFEAENELGGTWYQNIYPGCACDVQSHMYSFAAEANPYWSRKYSGQQEILQYLKNVVAKHGLKINFNTRVKSATWNPGSQKYNIEFNDDRTPMTANFVVYGAGVLREPAYPEFPGINDFEGINFHSAYWDKSVDVKDKRVAIVGTGASAVQIVPSICDDVKKLYVYQRTPCWCPPRFDGEYPSWLKFIFAHVPGILYLSRLWIFLVAEFRYFTIFRTNSFVASGVRKFIERHIKVTVKDQDLAELLTPTFNMGCKRITPSDDYLAAFNCPKVELVTSKIDRITKNGILTADGIEKDVDIIVYATGFSVINSFRNAFEVYNGEGQSLNEVIQDEPKAFLGVTFPNFPNYFVLLGPHTGLGHNSVIWMIECSTNHIIDCIRKMSKSGISSISAKPVSFAEFQSLVRRYMENKVFFQGCLSWYRNKGGSGFNYTLWPSHLLHYWWLTKTADLDDYDCVVDRKSLDATTKDE